MVRSSSHGTKTGAQLPKIDFWKRLKEIDKFFEGRGREHKTLHRLVEKLEKAQIPYAILGGMAVNAHGHQQTTDDVDVLLTREGFAEFCRRFVPKSYDPVEGRPRRFLDRRYRVTLDVLVTGSFPGSGKPRPVSFPDPTEVGEVIQDMRFVNLTVLIQLKLAARRYRDLGDVGALIRVHELDETFAKRLHPSLRRDYRECLEENRREEEYEAREG